MALSLALTLTLSLAFPGKAGADEAPMSTTLKIGLLPVADTVLLIAADRRGYFAEEGLAVELVSFQSALEKDAAAMAGALDGHFCEIISAIVQQAAGRDFKVAAATSATSPDTRMFGLVTSPGSSKLGLEGLKGRKLLIARQTITDFLADVFFKTKGLGIDYMERQDVRKIPVRMQILAGDRADAALVPEPMLSIAEAAGGMTVMDDREIAPMPLAVVALSGHLSPEVFAGFRKAIARSVAWVNSDPAGAKALMLERGLIPERLAESYRLPEFNPERLPDGLPDKALYDEYVSYLRRIGVLAEEGQGTGSGSGQAGQTGLPAPAYADVVRLPGD
jgi:NitT/TauT family transport system substrate-binding protein